MLEEEMFSSTRMKIQLQETCVEEYVVQLNS